MLKIKKSKIVPYSLILEHPAPKAYLNSITSKVVSHLIEKFKLTVIIKKFKRPEFQGIEIEASAFIVPIEIGNEILSFLNSLALNNTPTLIKSSKK